MKKEWPEFDPEEIGFMEGIGGVTDYTWVYWVWFVGWVFYRVQKTMSGEIRPLLPSGAIIMGSIFAILEFMFGLVATIRYYVIGPNATDPRMMFLDVWYVAYAAVWMVLWGFVATGIVVGVRWFCRAKMSSAVIH